MTTLFIVNHPPYGTEHAYNAVRLANVIAGDEDQEVEGHGHGLPTEGTRS